MDASQQLGLQEIALLEHEEEAREARFAELVARQSRFVFRVAYALLRNAHDAEDAVQETFLKLYCNGGWRQMQDEKAYLARVAWRIAVDKLPKAGKMASEALDEELPSSGVNPEEAAVAASQDALIHRMVDSLPEDLRQPLVLTALGELNSREVAAVLDIPEGTVRTRIQRARQILKQKLAGFVEVRHGR